VLRLRNRHYRRVEADETRDDDADGIPDVYTKPDPAIGS
jgi:NhaA family Na+:H+ antiporter